MTENQSPKPRLMKEFVDQRRELYKARKKGFIEGYLEVKESLPRLAAALESQGVSESKINAIIAELQKDFSKDPEESFEELLAQEKLNSR